MISRKAVKDSKFEIPNWNLKFEWPTTGRSAAAGINVIAGGEDFAAGRSLSFANEGHAPRRFASVSPLNR